MSSHTISMTDNLYAYLLHHTVRENDVLKALREETGKLPNAQMEISPEQGQLMALLLELINAKRVLEIGTYTGYSALVMAYALPTDGSLITCDINVHDTNIAKKYWELAGFSQKISLRLAPALETLAQLLLENQHESFDFAFIDADKANYDTYYEQCLKLIRRGGLIAVDNTLWSGDVADLSINDKSTVAIRNLNQKLLHDQRVSISLIPIGDGLMLARKR